MTHHTNRRPFSTRQSLAAPFIATSLTSLFAANQGTAAPRLVPAATHVTVRHERGRCSGWPANGGIWSWGNEILVQSRGGVFQDQPVGSHDIHFDKPIQIEPSRSFTGMLSASSTRRSTRSWRRPRCLSKVTRDLLAFTFSSAAPQRIL